MQTQPPPDGGPGAPQGGQGGEQPSVPPWKTWQRDSDIPERRNLIHQMCGPRPPSRTTLRACISWPQRGGSTEIQFSPVVFTPRAPQPEALPAAEAQRHD